MIAVFAIVVLIAGGGVAYLLLLAKPITSADLTTATTAATNMNSDLTDAALALTTISVGSDSLTDLNSQLSTMTSKLNDAQTQFNAVKDSPVLHDSATNKAFQALNTKWQPYVAFLQNSGTDYKTMGPVAVNLQAGLDAATKLPTDNNAQYAAYLAALSAAVNTAQTQAAGLHMTLTGDQQTVTALKTYLRAASADTIKAKADLSRNDLSAVYDDENNLDSAQETFQKTSDAATQQLNDQEKSLDPSQQITDFLNALTTLATKVKS